LDGRIACGVAAGIACVAATVGVGVDLERV